MTARRLHGANGPETDPLIGFRPWFYAAAVYNLLWGGLIILFPQAMFMWMGLRRRPIYPCGRWGGC
jgi:hypothetical protein